MRIQVKSKTDAHHFDAAHDEKILFSGLRCGIALPYECATGTCGTCKARLIEGEIVDGWATAPGKKSFRTGQQDFLMCQCMARGDVAIEVSNAVAALETGACAVRAMTGVLSDLRYLTHDVAAIDIELDAPCDFEAGQFMAVSAPGVTGMRGYSMVNFARDTRSLQFLIKKKPGGGFSEWLFGGYAKGASLDLFGPLGKATFDPGMQKNILCIAGGSGIAGMTSILSRACEAHYFDRYRGHVFFGVRTMKDAFYLDAFSGFCRDFPANLSVVVALSDQNVPEAAAQYPDLRFAHGLVHEVAKHDMAGRYENIRAYVAGPPPVVDATIRVLLLEAKLKAENIRYDKFS